MKNLARMSPSTTPGCCKRRMCGVLRPGFSLTNDRSYVVPGDCMPCRSRGRACEEWNENQGVQIETPVPSFCRHLQLPASCSPNWALEFEKEPAQEKEDERRGAPFKVALDWIHPIPLKLEEPKALAFSKEEVLELPKSLPEEVAEKIVAMVQFPYLFKARTLSKGWEAKFSAAASCGSSSFQSEVLLRSRNWPSCCPGFGRFTSGSWTAYDRTTQTWRKMPSLSFLPESIAIIESSYSITGPLLAGIVDDDCGDKFFVSNFVTREWKVLPTCPISGELLQYKVLCDEGSATYTLIAFFGIVEDLKGLQRRPLKYEAGVYYSRSNTWKCSMLSSTVQLAGEFSLAYMDGMIYMFGAKCQFWNRPRESPATLLGFSVKTATWQEFNMQFHHPEASWPSKLLVCEGDLMVVTNTTSDTALVLKVDLLTQEFKLVCRGPPKISDFCQPVADGNHIYFNDCVHNPVLTYNVRNGDWKRIPAPPHALDKGYIWIPFSVDLRANPFVAV